MEGDIVECDMVDGDIVDIVDCNIVDSESGEWT